MTAPLPPDPADVLTRLEELHNAATTGPWEQDRYEIQGLRHRLVAETGWRPDAAAIVVEHNAIPALLAAVRGVLALADGLDSMSDPYSGRAADRLRAVVAAALGETGGGQ